MNRKIDWPIVGLVILLTILFCAALGFALYSEFKTNTMTQNIQFILHRWWIFGLVLAGFMGLTHKYWLQKKE